MTEVLVTGSTGFVGRHLVRKLVSLHYDCRCMVRDPSKARPILGQGVDIVKGDLTSPESVRRCIDGCTHVVHLAAQLGRWGVRRPQYRTTNVDGTRNVIAACEDAGVELLVHCSTAGVVGIHGYVAADEQTQCRPITPYETSKLEAEREVQAAAQQSRIRAIVARLDFVYGPEDVRRAPLYATIRQGRFFLIGRGDALIRPTYVEDAADGLIACLNHPECSGEIFNIGGPDRVSAREFVRTIQEALGVEPRILFIPRFMAYAGALVCEGISVLVSREPLLTVGRARFWSAHHASSVEKASTLLGFRARTPLALGMEKTVSWFKTLESSSPAPAKLFRSSPS